ncbi:MAG: J domain-containing protein [Acidobacteriia bacterium]|nr:J domain-containing protein [Terriglobia bacterium]
MKNRRNYYRILQIQPDAPVEIIRASYRTMMLELKQHPDLGGSTSDASVLNEAYQVLSDPVRRAAYDDELFLKYAKQAEAPGKRPLSSVFCPVCKRACARKAGPGERCLTCQSPLQSEKPADQKRAYQRALSRTRRDDKVFYYPSWPGKARRGKMIDFSPQGMRFLCSERLIPGTVLKIRSKLFDASGAVTNLRREEAGEADLYTVGVSFLAVSFAEPKGSLISTSA